MTERKDEAHPLSPRTGSCWNGRGSIWNNGTERRCSLTRAGLKQINERSKRPFAFYLHPWELDPGQHGTTILSCPLAASREGLIY
jgi:Domain of unknown function (DUF3473)